MKRFLKNYSFLLLMLLGIGAGCVVGALFPVVRGGAGEVIAPGATVLEPLGAVFINLMFCVVVPMVFCSICSAIANMESAGKAGRIMGITLAVFLATAAIAALGSRLSSITSVKRMLNMRFVCFLTVNISFSEEINTQKACMQSRLRYNNTH